MRRLCWFLTAALAGCAPGALSGGPDAPDPAGPDAGGPGSPPGNPPGMPGDPPEVPPMMPPPDVEELPDYEPAPATLYRLTRAQYQNCLRDLLGAVDVPADLEADTPLHGFASVGASELTVSPRAAEQLEAAAFAVAGQVFGDAERRQALVGCDLGEAGCVDDFLRRFGRLAWRRPLSGEEVGELSALYAELLRTLRDPWRAAEFTVATVLQSPWFVFRVERGEGAEGQRRYSDVEMASRLSFLIWNSAPDDALLAAGERGELATPAGLETQARRLLADDRAREAMRHFFGEFFLLDRLDGLTKDRDVFPQMSPTLGAAMRREVEAMIDDVVFGRDADLRSLLTTRDTFLDAELAALYGLPPVEGPGHQPVHLPPDNPRGGLLGTAGILALNAHNTVTSPTLRGKFIQNTLLCFDIPPPPPGIPQLSDSEDGPETTRQKLERHRSDPSCNGCHQFMDPLGVSLENFDAIGAFRTTEAGLAIDARAVFEGQTFEGPRQLGELLREREEIGACFARRFFRHGMGHLESEAEERAVRDLIDAFRASDHRFQALVVALVTSDAFRLVGEDE